MLQLADLSSVMSCGCVVSSKPYACMCQLIYQVAAVHAGQIVFCIPSSNSHGKLLLHVSRGTLLLLSW